MAQGTGDVHFHDLEITPLKVIRDQGQCGFRILGIKFLLVLLSNHGYISNGFDAMGAESFRYNENKNDNEDRHAV